MLALYLLRHAKSDWGDSGLDDLDRPLNSRGRHAARRIGIEMRRLALHPRLALCSTARRARDTLDLVLPALEPAPTVSYDATLYLADPAAMLMRLAAASVSPVLMVGHNPGIGDLANLLAGDGEPNGLAQMAERYPTGALAELHFEVGRWIDIAPGSGQLIRYIRPRELAVLS